MSIDPTPIAPSTVVDLSDPAALAALYAAFVQQQKTDRELAKIAREEAKATREALAREIAPHLVEAATTALAFHPTAPSEKSAWVGSVIPAVTVTIDGREYAITMSIKDVAATAERKDAQA